jgi:hypothetical protein
MVDEIFVLANDDFSTNNLRYLFRIYIPEAIRSGVNARVVMAYSGHGANDGVGDGYLLGRGARTLSDIVDAIIAIARMEAGTSHALRQEMDRLAGGRLSRLPHDDVYLVAERAQEAHEPLDRDIAKVASKHPDTSG